MSIPSRQIGWGTKANLLWQISKQLEQLIGVTSKAIPTTTTSTSTSTSTSTTTSTTTAVPVLRILFNDIANANILVGDASSVSDWNTFFDLPINGSPFTLVTIIGNEVFLYGGSGITIKTSLFYNNIDILTIYDTNSIIRINSAAFSYAENLVVADFPNITLTEASVFDSAYSLTTFNAPQLIVVGTQMFNGGPIQTINFPSAIVIESSAFLFTYELTSISIPSCLTLGSTVGDNQVFGGITGNTITLTVPAALMTCNGGLPDGDIQYLQANNTVTIVTV